MKALLVLAIAILASTACDAANATQPIDTDFDVVSVVPRSPNVRPFVMSISAKDRHKRTARQQMRVLAANR
jgi:hypothetical protein